MILRAHAIQRVYYGKYIDNYAEVSDRYETLYYAEDNWVKL
jgi:hypothetical protein